MIIFLSSIVCDDVFLLLLLISISRIVASSLLLTGNNNNNNNDDSTRRADEYIMTSASIDGIKRSNVCGDGYRIEGALLRSYPYVQRPSYLPYENCYMTFQARRSDNQIRIRILSLDLNDILGGLNCLDSLRFYKSPYITRQDKLNILECGQLTEAQRFDVISPTGIVTAHFTTDGGNVSGEGFKVVLTAFRTPNRTHPCDPNDDEFLCASHECISSSLLCDGVGHCRDSSDEIPIRSCGGSVAKPLAMPSRSTLSKDHHWRGVVIAGFSLIIFIGFTLFMAYCVCRRCIRPPMPLMAGERKNYATIVSTPLNGPKVHTTQVILQNPKVSHRGLDDDYNSL